MTTLSTVSELLEKCSTEHTKFPATDLYSEGWMLRIVLDWFSKHPEVEHEISINSSLDWYSEARLPSTFLPRKRGDKFAEGHTHADGVIGEFSIREGVESEFILNSCATTFIVTEAKMFSKLSPRTSNCNYYNQAARNVGCIAEVLSRVDLKPEKLDRLGFYVLAPESRINDGIFSRYMEKEHIHKTVKRRVDDYDESKVEWFDSWFLPLMDVIEIRCISWEDLVNFIVIHESEMKESLSEFYGL